MLTIAPMHDIIQPHRASTRYVLLFLFYFYLIISSFSDVDNCTNAQQHVPVRYVLLFSFYFYLMISSFSDLNNRTNARRRPATPYQYQVCPFILVLFLPDDLQL